MFSPHTLDGGEKNTIESRIAFSTSAAASASTEKRTAVIVNAAACALPGL